MEKVGDIMTVGVKTVNKYETVQEAAKIMRDMEFGSLVVVDKGQAKGMLTERDIISKAVAQGLDTSISLGDIMSEPLMVIGPHETIENALNRMKKYKIKKLPVLDGGRIVGIISITDIVRDIPQLSKKADECYLNIQKLKRTRR